jgi:hypothetical protein
MVMIPVYVVGLVEVFVPPTTPARTLDLSFHQPWQAPAPRTKTNPNGGAVLLYNPSPPAITPTAYGFYQPWLPPVSFKKAGPAGGSPFLYVPPTAAAATPDLSFYLPWQAPAPRTKTNPKAGAVFVDTTAIARTPTVYGFYQPLSLTPRRHTPTNVGAANFLVYNPSPPAVTPTQYGFFQPLSRVPVRTTYNRGPAYFVGPNPIISSTVTITVTGVQGTGYIGTVLVWGVIPGTNTPGWVAIPNVQAPGWQDIDDSEGTDWTEILT